jgi:D-glycero-alpha-D-manno-heptose-7-phosphate kinase
MTIRSRAPLRLGLAGGGTDLSPFCDEHGGAVLNCTIDRYAYAFLEPRQDGLIVFRARDLTREEQHAAGAPLDSAEGLRLHRGIYNRFAAMGRLGEGGLTLTTTVDAPAGSGLGSSSALVVAICEAFRSLSAAPLGLYDLAKLAYDIERVDLNLAGGRQDQYAAAFGGVNFIEFLAGGRVIVNPLRVDPSVLKELETSLVTCFTGVSRESNNIIEQQTSNMERKDETALKALFEMRQASVEMKEALLRGDMPAMGEILQRSWRSKKLTSSVISSDFIESIFEAGLNAGAYAGKLSGAGGGGFIIFLVPPDERSALVAKLRETGVEAGPVHLTSRGVETWMAPTPK